MDELKRALPGLSAAAFLFGHRALGVLTSGRRPNVAALAAALGLSQRTLERRFRADGLPGPKALLDWLTLAYLQQVSRVQQRSVARVAAELELASNDLYRLRKRVLRSAKLGGNERRTSPAPAAARRPLMTVAPPVTTHSRPASPLCSERADT
jgi:AraC-like DNA-binding protein